MSDEDQVARAIAMSLEQHDGPSNEVSAVAPPSSALVDVPSTSSSSNTPPVSGTEASFVPPSSSLTAPMVFPSFQVSSP